MSLDANDILKAHGSDGLRDVFDHALKMNGHDRVDPAPLPSPSVEILPATAFTVEPIRWIWDGWLARGKLHLLAGAPGTGKTTIGISTAATITTGRRWPDGSNAEQGDVLIWTGEDGIADTLLPRFLAAGGDPSRVHFVNSMQERGKSRPFDPATDMPKLVEAARKLPELKMVILDPVVAAVSGDSHKNTETRRGLQPVVDLADQLDCAVLGITHLSKNTGGREPLERVAGSIAFGAVARVVLATVKPADTEAPRRLVRAKSNLGPDTGGFEYTLFGVPVPGHDFGAQRVDWGEALEGSARELMAVEKADDEEDALAEAEAFLTDLLGSGPLPTKEIKTAADAHGHTWRTVRRAKDQLGITATKAANAGFSSGWQWQLPPPANVTTMDREDVQQA
jgi:putative DNA primase/helicase